MVIVLFDPVGAVSRRILGICFGLLALLALLSKPLAASAAETNHNFDRQFSPSSRNTPIVVSEIHFHPSDAQGADAEFVELFNSEPVPQDLGGFQLRGDVQFQLDRKSTL